MGNQSNSPASLEHREPVQNGAGNDIAKAGVIMPYMKLEISAPEGTSVAKAIARMANVVSISVLASAGTWIAVYLHTNW
ncbi:MAG: hypothetical protein ACTIDN_04980 [Acetobacter sp.]|uniref:hypothetical protein n=1 Tax=Acetobacter sp. TaxID=440 RepID=UPI003F904655